MHRVKHVLVIDDDELARLVLRAILEPVPGLRVTLADGGQATLDLLRDNTYDLILLDLLMPGIGGIEMLTRLRKLPANRTTPVIITSVMADADTRIVCGSLRIADYMVKPLRRERVIGTVQGALQEAAVAA